MAVSDQGSMKSFYKILEVKNDAQLIEIKKAYKRLALKHHPDRNNGSKESTERFKEISEAYNILSDPSLRRDYDLSLKSPTGTSGAGYAATYKSASRSQRSKDPFKQFDDLFRHDPFFNDAFKDIDDVFAKRFEKSADDLQDKANSNGSDEQHQDPLFGAFTCGGKEPEKPKQSWGEWIMNKLGIEVTVTSYSHEKDGSVLATNYTSKPGTSTSKKTRTYMENGKQVTVMSMEKNGNKIEDKFIGGVLIERKVNGIIEQSERISS